MSQIHLCYTCKSQGDSKALGEGRYGDLTGEAHLDIPICPTCGGLGVIHPEPEFKEMVLAVNAACLKYAPRPTRTTSTTHGLNLRRLRELQSRVTELWERFGNGKACFAKSIARDGHLDPTIKLYESLVARDLAMMEHGQYRSALQYTTLRALVTGDVEELESIGENTSDIEAIFLVGTLLQVACQEFERSVPFVVRAAQMQPDSPLYRLFAMQTLLGLGRREEALEWAIGHEVDMRTIAKEVVRVVEHLHRPQLEH